ncbi:elongation factor Ts, mitochondrial isoform X3 [Malania oleifera]|uniref:elongation factor Ts, mitochondrial isoform X3 n=1 Tax=Malania oleifera TaxID=397392 RepID=UPI0025ADC1BB|nr:elongation factor Ts, mitochondrial isoform X3 [Malania oleifera]XP_057983237.1 elongation factor Ts, mitochondrial isoform X3 [Malania oleifera]XP_057983238.1 elongation factor Ts, mitochondrial isoform X3 [Malania oleifera]XP_057983239.1 elongation factor Ts, mitochondrial isoform X3 [Malania oleifera]XP_057983240.1 elongation factor Ts, mitochondrial isoform X3 [Malania oleifera]
MAFYVGAKSSIKVLYNRLSSRTISTQTYSTWVCGGGTSIAEVRVSSFASNHSNLHCASGLFLRRFSVEIPASNQMDLIKQLREQTSAPIKDVKSALIDCKWDIEAAQKDLRKRGVVLASKKSSRTAAEGLLALAQDESKAAVVELNCETDFVARNEIFQHLASSLAKLALSAESSQQASGLFPLGPDYFENSNICLGHPKLRGETTVQSAITEVAAMMGENVKLRRGFVMSAPSGGVISTYLHTSPQQGLGRIAGIVTLELDDGNASLDALRRVGSELAMHVVAAKPLFLAKENVSFDAMESEREILKSQAEATGKSQMAIEKMVEGRLRKYLEEVVFMEQKFIVQDAINVKVRNIRCI